MKHYIIVKEMDKKFELVESSELLQDKVILETVGVDNVAGLDIAIMDEFVMVSNGFSDKSNFKIHVKNNGKVKTKELKGTVIVCESYDGKLGGFEENKAKELQGNLNFE